MTIVPNFTHEIGAHCESASLRDVLNWAGFPVSEPLVFGLDATLGFAFIDNIAAGTQGMAQDFLGGMPFFVGGKQGTITKNSLVCRVLGAIIDEQTFASADKAWAAARNYIDAGQPLIICVDMYYLPYHSTFHQFHFGRHAVALAGYDASRDVALVGDVEFADLQEVPVEDLKRARGSTFGGKYMGAHNTQFAIQARPDGKHPPIAAGAKLAIQQEVKNMLAASMSHEGVPALRKFAASIRHWPERMEGKMAKNTLSQVYGYIEEYGTGGAIFRKLYLAFLEELLGNPDIVDSSAPRAWLPADIALVEEVLPILSQDIDAWGSLGGQLKSAVDEGGEDCMSYLDLEQLAAEAESIAAREQEIFTRLSRLKI